MRTAGQGPGGFEKDGIKARSGSGDMAGFAGLAETDRSSRKKGEKLEGHFAPSFLRCLEER